MVDVKALIAKAKAETEQSEWAVVPVMVADELVDVGFRPVAGHVWADLTAQNPPRPGATRDNNVGFNTDAVAADYPLECVTVDGEPVDRDTWTDFLAVLPSPSLKIIAASLWGMNQFDPQQRIVELGKARAGDSTKRRRSPAK